jgi:hypothetical protein
MSDIRSAVKRSIRGEKTILASVSEGDDQFWIVPRKFSVAGFDAISDYRLALQKLFAKRTALIDKMKKALGDAGKLEESISEMSADEISAIVESVPEEAQHKRRLYDIYLRFGIAVHNLAGEESEKMPEDLIEAILESRELCEEIYGVVEGFNSFFSEPSKATA